MPQLRRNARPLLTKVGGKPHASSDDHEEADSTHAIRTSATKRRKSTRTQAESTMVTPPATNSTASSQNLQPNVIDLENEDEDWVNADPIDSDDEVFASKPVRASFEGFRSANVDLEEGCGKKVVEEVFRFAGLEEEGKNGSVGKKSKSPASGKKRGFRDITTGQEPEWLNGGTPKKQKKENVKTSMFAPPRTSQGYGKGSQRHREWKLKRASQEKKASPKKDAKAPAFQLLDIGNGADDSVSTDQPFAVPGAEDEDLGYARLSSSSLSSARTTPDPEELQVLDLPHATPYKPMVDCSYCGQPIEKFVVEEFEDKYNIGGDLSFKWKRRFCKFHRKQEAQDIWRERSYPTIEWTGLERRMRKHNAFLVDILNDRKSSHYRQTLKDKVKPRTKGIRQAYNAAMETKDGGSRPGASVGYYGPKGEKIMTDHIISSLADDIRKQAKKDKLVASSGVQGGVSGFVQAVLVPHLAEQLIKEDMKLTGDWSSQARDIITDSCEVGEILFPEVEDGVVEIPDDSDDD
ncbi:hypothetical protein M409DRAFT_60901 [Zasmidium cellare ATCC 36951]|uniref:Restriction of telomere capping protein 4 n=1 Tax=Zasmidium cellare ATCC 36951 TaxID=1080233 RepID=A0A6A6C0T5_ZASCE|nr:uncharacterized protein M409DRAFT_60901 [Zasmidium cellare ATCC 36951]KAF2159316.1 hypothetical protein M409DRAFT_60901 [Zasmidium cellare ATCC 36951]